MDIFIGVIVGIIVLILLIVAHEFGHFIMARKNGVKVLEFGIGFPPMAIAWVKDKKSGKWKRISRQEKKKPQDDLIFSLNYIPLGGFCQMDGESASDSRPGTFGYANFKAKTKILLGGVAANWLVAFVIFTILAWVGMPAFLDNQFTIKEDTKYSESYMIIKEVLPESPAGKAGILAGDKVLKVNDSTQINQIIDYSVEHAGETVLYTVERNISKCPEETPDCAEDSKNTETAILEIPVTYGAASDDYIFGVYYTADAYFAYSTWSAPLVGAGLTLQLTGETFVGLGQMLWDLVSGLVSQLSFDDTTREAGQAAVSAAGDSVAGPFSIIGVIFPSFTSAGVNAVAFLAAIISISLACMNILPIPALDGGRWLLIAIYKLRKKPLTKELEEKIVARAFLVLLALMVLITVLDIFKIAS